MPISRNCWKERRDLLEEERGAGVVDGILIS